MGVVTRDHVVTYLVGRGVARDLAVLYGDVFLTYREAADHLAEHGAVLAHPRTGAPMVNPYLSIRDQALRQLQAMRDVPAAALWQAPGEAAAGAQRGR